MAMFMFSTGDKAELEWIAAARAQYNTDNPQNQLKDDQAYFIWLASSWFASGAISSKRTSLTAAVEKAMAGDASDLKSIAGSM